MENKFAVVYHQHGPEIEQCFCRELVYDQEGNQLSCEDLGCGLSWDEARLSVAAWHLQQAEEWKEKKIEDYFGLVDDEPDELNFDADVEE